MRYGEVFETSGEAEILYFPGIRRLPDELAFTFSRLASAGFRVWTLPVPYDVGKDFSPVPFAEYLRSCGMNFQWWAGLSLGASVSWVLAAHLPEELLPKRLTLINPFSDRRKLAEIRGFSLEGQWPIVPEQYDLPPRIFAEMVLSENDEKIPEQCRTGLCRKLPREAVFRMKGDHAFTESETQFHLAERLLARSIF